MNCEKCGSSDTARCETVYEQGTVTGTANTAYGVASHTSQSKFAKQSSPPKTILDNESLSRSMGALLVVGLICLLLLPPVGVLLLALVGVWIIACFLPRPGFRRKYAEWQKKWICFRCGHIFKP